MVDIQNRLKDIKSTLPGDAVTLIAVSKNHPSESIMEAYEAGQRDFGENRVQELCGKYEALPRDIQWHLIGHLQTNKVRQIASFVSMIHSVDSLRLLEEISLQAIRHNRQIDVLLQIYIAEEESKFGLDQTEALDIIQHHSNFPGVRISGLMGMATNTSNEIQLRKEFSGLGHFFQQIKSSYFSDEVSFSVLCMGMSGDYKIAIEEGSNMVRIGSAIFGDRVM